MKRFLVFVLFLVIATSVFGQVTDPKPQEYVIQTKEGESIQDIYEDIAERLGALGITHKGGFPKTVTLKNSQNSRPLQKIWINQNGGEENLDITLKELLTLIKDYPELSIGPYRKFVAMSSKITFTDSTGNPVEANPSIRIDAKNKKVVFGASKETLVNPSIYTFSEKTTAVELKKKLVTNLVQPREEHGAHFFMGIAVIGENQGDQNYKARGELNLGSTIYENIRASLRLTYDNSTRQSDPTPLTYIQKNGQLCFELVDEEIKLQVALGAGYYEERNGHYDSDVFFPVQLHGSWIIWQDHMSFSATLRANTPIDRWAICPASEVEFEFFYQILPLGFNKNYALLAYVSVKVSLIPVKSEEGIKFGLDLSAISKTLKDHTARASAGGSVLHQKKIGFWGRGEYEAGIK